MKSQRKPGTWPSPLSAAMLAESGNVNIWPQVVGDDLWWDEMRPSEEGRTLIVSRQHGDLLKAPWSASTQVHEYGGLSWLGVVSNGKSLLYFVNKSDQRIYVTEVGGEPQPITPIVPENEIHRYAEMIYVNGEIWCVREKHQDGVVTRALVAVSAITQKTKDQTARFPTISRAPDGSSSGQYSGNKPQST